MIERLVLAGLWRNQIWSLGEVTYDPETCTPEDIYQKIAECLKAQATEFEFAAITGRIDLDGDDTGPGQDPDHD